MTTEDNTFTRTYKLHKLLEASVENIQTFLIMNIKVQFVLFNDRRKDKKLLKKVMFYFELRNFISIPCVVSTHSNGNNVKKVFW